jgi:hypothetical protein
LFLSRIDPELEPLEAPHEPQHNLVCEEGKRISLGQTCYL